MTDIDRPLLTRLWFDEVLDQSGHPLGSEYVERYWLPVLGPSSVMMLRYLGRELIMGDDRPTPTWTTTLGDLGTALGLGAKAGLNSPLVRTIKRLCSFRLANWDEPVNLLVVRYKLPSLTMGQRSRLSERYRNELVELARTVA